MPHYNTGTSGPSAGFDQATAVVSRWDAVLPADKGTFFQPNMITYGSDKERYYLNPDKGGGLQGNPNTDPTSAAGGATDDWVLIPSTTGSTTDANLTTSVVATDAPGGVPGDLPSGTDAEDGDLHTRTYNDAVITYNVIGGVWNIQSQYARAIPANVTTHLLADAQVGSATPEAPTEAQIIAPLPVAAVAGDYLTYTTPYAESVVEINYRITDNGGAFDLVRIGDGVSRYSGTNIPDPADFPVNSNTPITFNGEPFYTNDASTAWVAGTGTGGGTGDVTRAELAATDDTIVINGGNF